MAKVIRSSPCALALCIVNNVPTVPLARPIRLMAETFDDVLWPSMDFFQGTKLSKTALPIRPWIDYIFHAEQVSVKSATVLSQHIGDHLSVVAELALGNIENSIHEQIEQIDDDELRKDT